MMLKHGSSSIVLVLVIVHVMNLKYSAARESKKCYPLTHTYCNKFNYTHAIIPNERGHTTHEEAAAEFDHFIPILTANEGRGCHEQVGTLLCFVYFPICNASTFDEKLPSFYPCRETCEEVQASKNCTALLYSAGVSWSNLPQFQCSKFKSGHTDPNSCIRGPGPIYQMPTPTPVITSIPNPCENQCHEQANCVLSSSETSTDGHYTCVCREGFTGDGRTRCKDIDECAIGSHGCHKEAICTNTEGSYTCTCKERFIGDGFHCESGCSDGCSKCNYRTIAGGKTFKNNCFCFAARVTALYYGVENCVRTITVNVTEQFNVMIPHNNTVMTAAPDMVIGSNITINIGSLSCDICHNFTLGGDYLIAGTYEQTSDGNVNWKLPPGEKKSLVSKWDKKKKYTQKLKDWIKKGNDHRKDGNRCVNECSSG